MKTETSPLLRPQIDFDRSLAEFQANVSPRVIEALKVAAEIHKNDFRIVTGEPYLNHCVAVASLLTNWGADEDEVVAGLLHDTWEDHPEKITLDDIADNFNERVSHLVSGVTKLKSRRGEKNEFETLKKVTKESFIERGVALIKLADRLHNMLTMEGMSPMTQERKARETLAVYAPLAESFGLWQVKNLLQDLSFKYVEPKRYSLTTEMIDGDPRLETTFIEKREEELQKLLAQNGIRAEVGHQVGGYWEMAEKQKKFGMRASAQPNSFAEISDVISFRVVVEDGELADCYKALGIVRLFYEGKLMKQRHNDYLGVSAVNGYSALHDTYRFEEGDIEVAFSTKSKESFNNWGVVSLDKEELKKNPELYQRKLIFTPKKELVFMEIAARGIDVAYKLNPLLGLRAVGIMIDGKMNPLEAVVPNASEVEVMFDRDQTRPKVECLEYGNPSTRRWIEHQLLVAQRDEEVARGEEMIRSEILSERGILNIVDLDRSLVDKLLMELGCWNGLADLYYKAAYGLDLKLVGKKMDELGVVRGRYTSIQIRGINEIGISKDLAQIVNRFGGDVRSKVEKVDDRDKFVVRVLLTIGYEAKKKMEFELKEKFPDCVVI